MSKIGNMFIVISFVPLGIGLHKLFAYENSEYSFGDKVNVYVGGDAYNYIINSNLAAAYFVLFGVLFISGIILAATTESRTVAHGITKVPGDLDFR